MTFGLRFRIITLQIVLVVGLAFAAGFMFWGSNYVESTIQNQLAAQQITFPKANDPGISVVALTPRGGMHADGVANHNAMMKYAAPANGTAIIMTTGDQAETYADHYIKVHLADMGMTYSTASSLALTHPNNAADQALANTIFKGTTLRGMLLNAYGWSQVGGYTGMAAVLATLGSIVVLLTLVFESALAWRERTAAATRRLMVTTPTKATSTA